MTPIKLQTIFLPVYSAISEANFTGIKDISGFMRIVTVVI